MKALHRENFEIGIITMIVRLYQRLALLGLIGSLVPNFAYANPLSVSVVAHVQSTRNLFLFGSEVNALRNKTGKNTTEVICIFLH